MGIGHSVGSVTANNRMSYNITNDYPYITVDKIRSISVTIVGGETGFDFEGVINWALYSPTNSVLVYYIPKLTQNNAGCYIEIIYSE